MYFLNRAIHPKRLEQAAMELKGELDNGNENLILIHKYIRQQKLYSKEICDNLEYLRKYHSCLLFGEELQVTEYSYELAKNTL